MKLKESVVTKKKIIQIYLTEEERRNLEIQKKIDEMKKTVPVVVFVSGTEKAEEVLKNMIRIIKE